MISIDCADHNISSRKGTLVAMATCGFLRLINGKVETDSCFCLSWGILEFLKKCLLSSSLHLICVLFKSLNSIGYQGDK